MRLIKHILSVLAISLCSVAFAGSHAVEAHQINASGNEEVSEVVTHIAGVLERIGNDLGYKFMRGYVTGDEWSETKQSKLLMDHAYYSLLIIDKENPHPASPFHANFKGHIDVKVLVFNDAELAAREVARLKAENLDNLGAELITSDANGFRIKGYRVVNVAVAHGAEVVLLNEYDDCKEKNLITLAGRLEKEAW